MGMHKAYLPHWIATLALIALGELLFPLTTWWMWGMLTLYVGTVEGVALKRTGPRDTMTEFWEWILVGGMDRRAIVIGFGVYAAVRLVSVPGMIDGDPTGILRWAPPIALWGGGGVWLVRHLLKGGRDG